MAETKLHGYTVAERLNKMDVDLIELTPGTTTNACSDGEIIWSNEKVANAVSVPSGTSILQSITLIDDDDHGGAIDLVFTDSSAVLGTEGGAISASDGSIPDSILGVVTISNYFDGVAWQVGHKQNIGMVLRGDASQDVYVHAINRSGGALTYSAAGLFLTVGIVKD